MNKYNMTRFFNQFIKTLRTGIKNIGVITDKDGTILINEDLKNILQEIKTKRTQIKLHFIANTGRTIADMTDGLRREEIPLDYFEYIVGDNGAHCLDVRQKKELFKNTINLEDVNNIINEFLSLGGNLENIRLADGEHIYAYDCPEVRRYYLKNQKVIFGVDFKDLKDMDITKLTLVGTHQQIVKIKNYIDKNMLNSKTHTGKTSFPSEDNDNYRVDFTRESYKRNSFKIY